jgi:hypothetical protein
MNELTKLTMRYFDRCIVKYYSRKVANTKYLQNTAYATQKPLLYALCLCARKSMKTGWCSYLNKIKKKKKKL